MFIWPIKEAPPPPPAEPEPEQIASKPSSPAEKKRRQSSVKGKDTKEVKDKLMSREVRFQQMHAETTPFGPFT